MEVFGKADLSVLGNRGSCALHQHERQLSLRQAAERTVAPALIERPTGTAQLDVLRRSRGHWPGEPALTFEDRWSPSPNVSLEVFPCDQCGRVMNRKTELKYVV
jgi:hypothetical protein